jgi:hypothetical protein
MPLILPGNVGSATASTGFDVDNSCRFNDADSPRLHKTEGSGNRDKWTFSAWIKRGRFTSGDWYVFRSQIDGNNYLHMRIEGDHQIYVSGVLSGSNNIIVEPSNMLRDPSAWMHIVLAVDTGQAVAANRVKWWINGTQVTSFSRSTYPDQNADTSVNGGGTFTVGATDGGGYAFDGYMAEVCLIDNAQLDADSFGEFDSNSPTIWKPIDVSGLTFGTNGFYLDFKASDNLGNDANGGTDLTEVNLDATDQATDTPTNSFCVINPLDNYHQGSTFSEGNCQVAMVSGKSEYHVGTFGLTAGKWYWEVKYTESGSDHTHLAGIADKMTVGSNTVASASAYSWMYYGNNGVYKNNGSDTSYGSAFTDGTILGIALDLDNNKLYFALDNTWQNSGDPTTGATGTGAISISAASGGADGVYYPAFQDYDNHATVTWTVNFGGCSAFSLSSAANDGNGYGAFEYAPPSGYLAICTKNLGSDGG